MVYLHVEVAMVLSDTSPDAARVQLERVRALGPEKRLIAALEQSQLARDLLRQGIAQRHPRYTQRQLDLALFAALLPPTLFTAAYPEAAELLP